MIRKLTTNTTLRALSSATAISALLTAPALAQNVFELDEIIFSGNLTEIEANRSGVTVEVITAEDLAEAGDIQIADYLSRLPSLHVTQDGPAGSNASVRLRGLGEQYIAVRINGIDVSDPSGTQSEFNFAGLTTSSISRIEVLYGSQSALYGSEAIAGVINIETVAVPNDIGTETTVEIEAGSYETVRGSIAVGTRTDRGTLAISASRLVTEGFSSADENLGNTEADGHRSTTVTVGGSYDVTDTITLGFDTLFQDLFTEFDSGAGPGRDGPQTEATQRRAGRIYGLAEFGAFSHEISVGLTQTERFFPIGFTRNFESERTEYRYIGNYDFGIDNTLSFGLEQSDESFMAGTTIGEISVTSAFADLTWMVSPDLDISVSGRLDDHSRFGNLTTLRAALAWRPNTDTVVRASVGQGARAPSLFELFSSFGDLNLRPEESLSFEVGVERDFGDLTLGATAFWINIDNLIGFDSAATACGSGFGCYNQLPGETRSQGLELSAAYEMSGSMSVFANYTYTDTETATGGRLPRVPLHQFNLGVSGELASGIDYQVTGTGAVDTSVSTFAPNALDDYFIVDALVSYEVSDGIDAYLRIENLFDDEYQTSPGYGTSDRAFYVGLRASF
ncbi:MAG: TonB-dependent receptor [Roseicyclus sp.]|nr:TonB-dependent receptor [Roseicyclus sp.]